MNETRCSGASGSPSSESAFPKCWLSPFLVCNGDRAPCVKLLCVGIITKCLAVAWMTLGLCHHQQSGPTKLVWPVLSLRTWKPLSLQAGWDQKDPLAGSRTRGSFHPRKDWCFNGKHQAWPHNSALLNPYHQIISEHVSLGSMTDLRSYIAWRAGQVSCGRDSAVCADLPQRGDQAEISGALRRSTAPAFGGPGGKLTS